MGEEDKETGPLAPELGAAIRNLRRERKMTLKALSSASGVSLGMLSQIERSRVNPSIRIVAAIRNVFDVPMSELFSVEKKEYQSHPKFVFRKNTHPVIDLGDIRKELLSGRGQTKLQIMLISVDPGASSGGAILNYEAQKGGIVMEGEIIIQVGDEKALLKEGDSFVFDSKLKHSFYNPADRECRMIWIISAISIDNHL